MPVGAARVVISGSKVTGKKLCNTPDGPEMPVTSEYLPAKYSDPLKTEPTFEVKRGAAEKNWDLPK